MRLAPTLLLMFPCMAAIAVDTPPAMTLGTTLLDGPTLLGDLGGLRSGFAEHGLVLDARFIADGSISSHDGLATQERAFVRHLLEVGLTMDVDAFVGLSGAGSITVAWQSLAGDDASDEIGTLQRVTWLDADGRDQVGRLFYLQPFFDGAFTLKAGKDEVARDFGVNAFAGEFLNGSARREPTAWAMPAFPDSTTMALAALDLDGWVVRFGAYDGSSLTQGSETGADWLKIPDNDVFLIAEAGISYDDRRSGHQGGVVVGAWQHTGTFTRFDGGTEADVRGYYLQGDLMLWSEGRTRTPQGLAGWIQLGMSDADLSAYHRHLGLGAIWRGPIPSRDRDAIGLSHSWLQTSRVAGAPTDADERVLELFYAFEAAGWLTLQPDIQWFVHPGGRSDRSDFIVGSLRGVVVF
jgi:porin